MNIVNKYKLKKYKTKKTLTNNHKKIKIYDRKIGYYTNMIGGSTSQGYTGIVDAGEEDLTLIDGNTGKQIEVKKGKTLSRTFLNGGHIIKFNTDQSGRANRAKEHDYYAFHIDNNITFLDADDLKLYEPNKTAENLTNNINKSAISKTKILIVSSKDNSDSSDIIVGGITNPSFSIGKIVKWEDVFILKLNDIIQKHHATEMHKGNFADFLDTKIKRTMKDEIGINFDLITQVLFNPAEKIVVIISIPLNLRMAYKINNNGVIGDNLSKSRDNYEEPLPMFPTKEENITISHERTGARRNDDYFIFPINMNSAIHYVMYRDFKSENDVQDMRLTKSGLNVKLKKLVYII
jgi:hypothetical protein